MRAALADVLAASRPFSWIDTALPFLAGALVVERAITPAVVLGFLYFLVPFNALMYGVNDIYDYESDVANPRKRSIEGGLVPPDRRGLLWAAVFVTNVPFLVVLPFVAGAATAGATAVAAIAALAYSVPPLRTKERPFLDSLTSASHFALPAVCGLLAAGMRVPDLPWIPLGGYVAWGVASHALGAIQDVEYDRAAGIGSIAVALGARRTAALSLVGYGIAVVTAATLGPGGLVAAAWLALYLLLPLENVRRPSEAAARRAWRGFLGLNLLVGFLLTQLLLRVWGIATYSASELLVGSATVAAALTLLNVAATAVATRRSAAARAVAASDDLPTLTIAIPCRDEANRLPATIASVIAQDYPALRILVVDDASSDGTAAIATAALRPLGRGARVISAGPKPEGWAGKSWAASRAVEVAESDLVLLLDADTVLEPDAARALVGALVAGGHDLVSGVTRYSMPSSVERALMPGFPLLLFGFLPLALLARTGGRPASLAFAYGPILLVRRTAYLAVRGHGAMPGSLREDVDLARTFARRRRRVGIVSAVDLAATRHYDTPGAIAAAWRRIFYAYCGDSPTLAVVALAGFAFAYVAPLVVTPLGLATSDPSLAVAGLVPLGLLVATRLTLALTTSQPLSTVAWHPITAVATLLFQLDGVAHGVTGSPRTWHGRTFPDTASPGDRP